MIKLASIGHVLLRVADEEASKRFYRDVLGFRVAEQDPEHDGVFMTLGNGFHTLDIIQHPAPADAVRTERGQLGLVHVAFKVDSYAALRDAYAHLLANGVEIQRAVDHICQRSIYFTDPDGNGLEIYYEMRDALSLFPNGRGDEDERLPPPSDRIKRKSEREFRQFDALSVRWGRPSRTSLWRRVSGRHAQGRAIVIQSRSLTREPARKSRRPCERQRAAVARRPGGLRSALSPNWRLPANK